MGKDLGMDVLEKKKPHRERHLGLKSREKKKKDLKHDPDTKLDNPKAFAFHSAVKAERRFRHNQDLQTKKQHIPLVDKTPLEPPPIFVGVVGPPKVGKSTLINSLIKLFTKTSLTEIKGPVTIVTGKKQRVTLMECNNDINSMIDMAKVADIILLLCDASFGFEMEVFEFLNICQVHGMPRIMGVLTHLDMLKNAKALKTTKKTLKHRFWTEVYAGAKLFYLSGILHGEYLRNEIKNLGRFILVMKFRPLTWRTTHSYLIGDRYEDLTSLETIRQNPKCDRNISLYGYVRGIPLNNNILVHVAGLGDLQIKDVSALPDPCPLPETIKKRALIEKERLIYAPFSGVGGIVYDKDAVYLELGGSHSHKERNNETNDIVTNLIDTRETLDVKMQHSELQLFTGGQKFRADDVNMTEEEAPTTLYSNSIKRDETDLNKELDDLRNNTNEIRVRRKVIFQQDDDELLKSLSDNSDSGDESDDNDDEHQIVSNVIEQYTILNQNRDSDIHQKLGEVLEVLDTKSKNKIVESSSEITVENDNESEYSGSEDIQFESEDDDDDADGLDTKWKENLAKKAEGAFLNRQNKTQNLMKLVYGVFESNFFKEPVPIENSELNKEEIGGLFHIASSQQKQKLDKETANLFESSLYSPWNSSFRDWLQPENKLLIKNCFVTGKWKNSEDAAELLKLDDMEMSNSDSDAFGDYEDLETGEKFTSEKKEKDKTEEEEKKALTEKKLKLKEKFNAEFDNADHSYYDELKMDAEKQSQLNKTMFENMPDELRTQIEGFRSGMYVRIEFQNVPAEFVNNFDPTYPIVVGALNMGEENIGYVNIRIKKHRWYKKILKTNDPLIISVGWRRFQTLPIYSNLEDDLKFRYLKYTPQHVTCNAHFWGPITPQGTGVLAIQSCSDKSEFAKQGFRVAATGVVQELDKSTEIMKKLKLIGHPLKIYKKTAFIKGMFNSSLEVTKFEGARIKTVSGIRGQIKKAAHKPEGCFRATFEDKIQLSDIVFCRTWFKVSVSQFYNPVTTLLLPPEQKANWSGARTTGQIKKDHGIKNQPDKNSLYTEIVRQPKVFKPLIIPKKLQQALPYRDKPKYKALLSDKKKPEERVAVIREPHEQKVTNMMKMLRASFTQKQQQLRTATKERLKNYKLEVEGQESKRVKKLQEQKKQVMRARSKQQNSSKNKRRR